MRMARQKINEIIIIVGNAIFTTFFCCCTFYVSCILIFIIIINMNNLLGCIFSRLMVLIKDYYTGGHVLNFLPSHFLLSSSFGLLVGTSTCESDMRQKTFQSIFFCARLFFVCINSVDGRNQTNACGFTCISIKIKKNCSLRYHVRLCVL